MIRLGRALLVLATLLLGVWAQTVRRLDETHVHVVCPDHGELIEQLHGPGPDRPEIGADPQLAHGEGCLVAWLATPHALPMDVPPPLPGAPVPAPEPRFALGAAGGVLPAPLVAAPKTSPPRA